VRGLWHGSPFFVEPKLLLKSVFAIFYFVCYSLSAQSEVITAEAGFIPEMGGSFCIEGRHYFYVGREKKLLILDDTLKPVQNLNLMTDTAAIDFADVTKSGRESLLEFSQTGVHVRHFEKNGFGNATRIAGERLAFPLYVDNLEQSRLAVDFNGDGFADLFLPAEGKFIVYENKKGQGFTKTAELPYQPRGSFTGRLWANSDLPSNSMRSTVIIPQPIFLDFNRDGQLDAAARIDERIYYFLSSKKAEGRIVPFAETLLRIYPMPQEDIYVAYAEFEDFDNDGSLDLVYSAVKGLGLNIRVDIKIFRGISGIPDPNTVVSHSIKGGVFSPLIAKLNKQKLMLVPTVDTGLGFFINYIVRSRVSLTMQLLHPLNTKDNPLEKTTLSFSSKESAIPGFAYGDYNNDGETDFILGTELDSISVFAGNADLSRKEIAQIKAPSYGIFRTVKRADGVHLLFIYMTQKSKAEKKNAVYLAPIR
jgi:hypothetical protein